MASYDYIRHLILNCSNAVDRNDQIKSTGMGKVNVKEPFMWFQCSFIKPENSFKIIIFFVFKLFRVLYFKKQNKWNWVIFPPFNKIF